MGINVKDNRGFNQGFALTAANEVRMKRRAQFMMSKMGSDENESVLEIGCGRGEIAFWIAEATGKKVTGTDLCVPFIEQARLNYTLPNLSYEVLDFNRPKSVPNLSYDYIIGNGILHHLYYNLNEALRKLYELLKPGGKIIFIEPNIYNPYCALIFKIPPARKLANLEPDEMAFSGSFIRSKLKSGSFTNIETRYKDFLLPGVPEWSVNKLIALGDVLEKIPVVNLLAQSVFISAQKTMI